MKVVSNSSPLTFFGKVDALPLLADCFASVVVPDAVVDELQNQPLPGFIQTHALSVAGQGFVETGLCRRGVRAAAPRRIGRHAPGAGAAGRPVVKGGQGGTAIATQADDDLVVGPAKSAHVSPD